jgi:polysaccharide biosynthesis protein PslA
MLLQQISLQWPDPGTLSGQQSALPIQNYRRLPLHRWAIVLILGDLLGAIALSFLNYGDFAEPLRDGRWQLWAGTGTFVILWGLVAHSQQLYRRSTLLDSFRAQILRCAGSIALTFGLLLLLAFGSKLIDGLSRIWLLAWAASALAWSVGLRLAWHRHLRTLLARGRCLDRALLCIGSGGTERNVSADIERETLGEVRIVATAPIPGTPGGPSLDWVENAVRMSLVDRVLIICFESAMTETNALLTRLARLAVEVTLIPALEGISAPVLRVDRIGSRVAVDVNLLPLSALQALAKRAEDLVLASLALIVVLPVFGLVSLAIKLDTPGPVFFRQWRAGFHDHKFRLWKFRTMHHNLRDENAVCQTTRTDNRVTRTGRLLRRTSIDELPQLLNVIRGEMSVVGPRPHALGMTATGQPLHEAETEYSARHRMKPGITGWAQVCGCRGEIDSPGKLRRRVAHDCYYIENWSLGFDLWIILRTVVTLLFNKDAY